MLLAAAPSQTAARQAQLSGDLYPMAAQPAGKRVKVRVKDVARLSGNESYTLTGYGVVVGLAGTGDSDSSLIQRTISNIMQNFNVIVDEADVKAKNTACVMVTATIKGKAHRGDMIEASVSAVGDSKSLLGGALLLTPLLGADGEVWGVAQGPVTTGGFLFGDSGAGGNQKVKNHPTAGLLSNGVKLMRDVGGLLGGKDMITYYLRNPDFTSAVNLSETINKRFFASAVALDSATVRIRVPSEYKDEERVVQFISEVEQLEFQTDTIARVVFNEKTGTIVIGSEVKISEAVITHGNITVNIKKTDMASQPNSFTRGGETMRLNDTRTDVSGDEKAKFTKIDDIVTVGQMVDMLNRLGVGARDMMMIFHSLKAAGALHAELEAM
jgi:flagellar P-ring protein precursor FlgI